MTALSSKNNQEILFKVAEDYLKLNFTARFNIGMQLKLVDDIDAYSLDEDEIDKQIFTSVVQKDMLPLFVKLITKAEL